MDRRGFLKQLGQSLLLMVGAVIPFGIGRSLLSATEFEPKHLLRPPGAKKNDAEFVQACIGCALCAEVCLPRCIRFYRNSGSDKQHTPYIDPKAKACTLCMKCMQVCPTDALTLVPRDQVKMGVAKIDRNICYPWVNKGICGACVSICPLGEQAISFKQANIYRPFVKPACVGCGLCVEVCPYPDKAIVVEKVA